MEHFTPAEAPIHETRRLPVLPPAKTVGRNAELGQTFAQVRAGKAVLLYGPSGIGKSALATTIASAFTAFSGGVLWWQVESDPLELLIVRLGRAYGERAISDSPNPTSQIAAAQRLLQREQKPLIVLDGVLNLDAVRDFVTRVVPGVPTILTNESSEPGPWTSIPLSYLKDTDAVALFMQAAGYEQVSSVVRVDIQGVCNILRGSPLAIMLAARCVRVTGQTPGEFLGTLTTPGRSGPLLGLNSVFQGLPEALQGMLFTLGATFAGRATTTLLESLNPSPAETLTHILGMLAARGLIQPLPCGGSATCYRMHEMVQSFATSWLHGAQRLESTVARIQEAIVAYVERYAVDSREARDALVAEMPNILSAAHYAARRNDRETVQRLVAALAAAFGPSGGYGYELRHLQDMLARLQAPPAASPEQTLADLAQMALFPPEERPASAQMPVATMPSVTAAGSDLTYDTKPMPPVSAPTRGVPPVPVAQETVEPEIEPALEAPPPPEIEAEPEFTFEEPGAEAPTTDISGTEATAGRVVAEEGPEIFEPFDAAEEAAPALPAEETDEIGDLFAASEAALASGNLRQAAATLNALGQALLRQDRLDEARETFVEALTASENSGDSDQMLVALESLASISVSDGDLENAITYATRAENLVVQRDDPARWGYLLALLGDIRQELGEPDQAIETYRLAIDKFTLAGELLSVGVIKTKLGGIYLDQNNAAQAVPVLNDASAIFEQEHRADYQERALGYLGSAYGQLGRWEEAETRHQAALTLARSMGDAEEQERQIENLAYIAQVRGDRERMLAYYRQGLDLAYRVGAVVWQVRFLDVLGRLLMDDLPRVGLAVRLLEEAESLVPDEERARLISRAHKRLERAQASGVAQEPAPEKVAAWAAQG